MDGTCERLVRRPFGYVRKRFDLPRLQSEQEVTRLLITLVPPSETGVRWSTWRTLSAHADRSKRC